MWVLQLNDMRFGNIETMRVVATASSREDLESFLFKEKVDPYSDERWRKSYRKGGPLEWFNPPSPLDNNFVKIKTKEEYEQHYYQQIDDLKSQALVNL